MEKSKQLCIQQGELLIGDDLTIGEIIEFIINGVLGVQQILSENDISLDLVEAIMNTKQYDKLQEAGYTEEEIEKILS